MCAKCSVWPASWKSARQSSGPPIGWITSMTRPGTSIGEQNARGLLRGRGSTSSSTFAATQVDPEIPERAVERGEHRRGGEGLVPVGRAEQAQAGPAASPPRAGSRAGRGRARRTSDVELLGRVQQLLARLGELGRAEVEALVQLEVGGAPSARAASRHRAIARGRSGSAARRRARRGRARAAAAARGRARSRSSARSSRNRSARRPPRLRASPRAPPASSVSRASGCPR